MVAVTAWNQFFALALPAFIDRHVAKAFEESPMNPPQFSTAVPTLHPS
jgi:hypothetical protein